MPERQRVTEERGPEPSLLTEARRLDAEVEALLADKRRLDWIEANAEVFLYDDDATAYRRVRTRDVTLREAIDRAMGGPGGTAREGR